MLGYQNLGGRRPGGTSVWTVFLWILLLIAAGLATLGAIFAILAFNREGFDETNILAAIATLQECCGVVSDGVSSLLTSMSAVLSSLSAITVIVSSTSETVSTNQICMPIASIPSPGGLVITQPSCWIVQNDLTCSLTSSACITVASPGVTIFGSGYTLWLGPSTSALVVGYSPKFTLENLRIVNDPPSNTPANVGLTVMGSSDVTIERVTFNGSCNGALFYDADALRIDRCLFTQIKHINASTGVTNFVNPLVVNGGNGVTLVDTTFSHVDGSMAPTPAFNPYFQDNAFTFFGSPTTGLPVQGLSIERVNVIDGAYVWLAPVSSGTIRDLHVLVLNPNSMYNIIEVTYGGPPTESLLIKDSSFRNDNAYHTADGFVSNRPAGITLDNVEIAFNGDGLLPYDPAVTGPVYSYLTGALHLNAAFSASYHHTQGNAGAFMVGSGFVVKNSRFFGYTPAQGSMRGRIGVLVDANLEEVHIINTLFDNFGGYVPANASANIPELVGGPIVVAPGSRGVRVSECKIYNSGNGSPQGGNGILFMGQTNITVIPALGSGTTVWPAAANCTAIDNQIFDNAGYAILDEGTGTVLYGNRQGGNWAGSYSSINSPVIVAPGSPALAGQNI